MKQIVVRLIIAFILVAFAQACALITNNPDSESNAEREQEFQRMDRMLSPSPNTEQRCRFLPDTCYLALIQATCGALREMPATIRVCRQAMVYK
jgi:hypothetical protein